MNDLFKKFMAADAPKKTVPVSEITNEKHSGDNRRSFIRKSSLADWP